MCYNTLGVNQMYLPLTPRFNTNFTQLKSFYASLTITRPISHGEADKYIDLPSWTSSISRISIVRVPVHQPRFPAQTPDHTIDLIITLPCEKWDNDPNEKHSTWKTITRISKVGC
jgi:hypothetical protein